MTTVPASPTSAGAEPRKGGTFGAKEVGVIGPTRFVCAFPEMLPMLIFKDVGQIPYHLARELGWQCELVYWMKSSLELIAPSDYESWVRRVSLGVSPSRARRTWLFLKYLALHSKKIDVLLLYHFTSEAILYALAYKAMNPRGVAVLKLDMDHRGLAAFDETRHTLKQRALKRLLATAPFDFLTIETEPMRESLAPHIAALGHELHVFPIGVDCSDSIDIDAVLSAKENILLTAGRLGEMQKNNELLLDALESLDEEILKKWSFWFVGSRTPAFDERLTRLRKQRADLAERIVTRDFVASRQELADIYKRSKVYCLTSRWESFAIVLAEAASYGCYLVSTNVGAAAELTGGGADGTLVTREDVGELAEALRSIFSGVTPTEEPARRAHRHVRASYRWPNVVRRFAALVQHHRSASESVN